RRRNIDRDLDSRVPVPRDCEGSADDLLRQSIHEADFLGDRDELIRWDNTRKRVTPARKNLETDDLAGLQVHLWFEERKELLVLEAEPNALFDFTMGDKRALHRRVEP